MAKDLTNSPVLDLEHNITAAFDAFEARLEDVISRGELDRELQLDMTPSVPRCPSITQRPSGPQIDVQTAYLELLWAFIYSWMVLYEETVQGAQLIGEAVGYTNDGNHVLVARAELLLRWAEGLRAQYSPWPTDLPSPRQQASEQEVFYAEKANFVFERATSFVLCHELAHSTQGHLSVGQIRHGDPMRHQIENEADQRAFDRLVGQDLFDDEKVAQAWAIIAALLAPVYAVKDRKAALQTASRSPVHHRLSHLMRSLAFSEEGYRYYFPLLCRMILQDIFAEMLPPFVQQFEDAAEALEAVLDELDRVRV